MCVYLWTWGEFFVCCTSHLLPLPVPDKWLALLVSSVCICLFISGTGAQLHYWLNLQKGKQQAHPSAWAESPDPWTLSGPEIPRAAGGGGNALNIIDISLHNLWNFMVIGESSWGLKKRKCYVFLQEEQERRSRNYKPVNLILIPWKVMEQTFLETMLKNLNNNTMRDKKVTLNNCHGFLKVKSCLSNLMAFYGEINRQRNNIEYFFLWL